MLNFDESALDVIPQAVRRWDFKGTLKLIRNSQIAIPLSDLPTSLGAALKRLGTIANPLFYEKQRLRFPTVNIRLVSPNQPSNITDTSIFN